MKSICLVVQNVYDVDPRVRRKAEALVSAGYLVDVLALRPPGGKKAYSLCGVNVRAISLSKKRGSLARYLFEYAAFFLWAFSRLPVQMARRRYTIIDINTLPDFLVFAAIVAKWMGAKVVLDMHEITPEFYMSKYGIPEHSVMVRVLRYIERVSAEFADHVITINEPIKDLLVQRGLTPAKTSVIMNAADTTRFGSFPIASASLPATSEQRFVLLYHGTLTRIYGLDIAIEAFAMAEKKMPGAELWILGSGPEQDALAQLAFDRRVATKVRLVGQVPSNEIPAWLSQCDVGILPIRRDAFLDFAFPNKLPEFIIMGKPVIVSRLKAIRYYFSDEALAYFEPNDAMGLSRRMIDLYEDRGSCKDLAARASEEYAPLRWDIMKQRYLSVVVDGIALDVGGVETSRVPANGGGF
jgi:glycosyltransferase involved in cell wall biosynthesis